MLERTFCKISRKVHSKEFNLKRDDLVFDGNGAPLFLLVAGPVLGGLAGVALASVGGRSVAGESLLAEHGVAVVEEQDGVTGALDRRDFSGLGALAGGAVREPACRIKYDFDFRKKCFVIYTNSRYI